MGMDVYGKKPTDEVGAYFRRNVWGWRPLWNLVEDLVPWVEQKVQYGHTNDGDGLNAEDSLALAMELRELLGNGTVDAYLRRRQAMLDAMPDEQCQYCEGTGVRTDEVGVKMRMDQKGWCNGCQGKGTIRPFETWYGTDRESVEEFVTFLEASGGFEIW